VNEYRHLLQEKGLRYSKPRDIILGYFKERDKHESAESLFGSLKERGHNLSLSTVYLNLGVLTEAGLIREFKGATGESVFDSNVSPHHHLICKGCGRVMDLPPLSIAGKTPKQFFKSHAEKVSGWKVDEPNLDLLGLCPECY
jgi:Fur family transcriptional regulator, peroxide stress response regulator